MILSIKPGYFVYWFRKEGAKKVETKKKKRAIAKCMIPLSPRSQNSCLSTKCSLKFTPHTLQSKPHILEYLTHGPPLFKLIDQSLDLLLHVLTLDDFFLKNTS